MAEGVRKLRVHCIVANCPYFRATVPLFTPRAHARARGYVIGRGVYYILYIYYIIIIYLQGLFSIFQNTHFQTPISAQEGFSSNLIAFSIP